MNPPVGHSQHFNKFVCTRANAANPVMPDPIRPCHHGHVVNCFGRGPEARETTHVDAYLLRRHQSCVGVPNETEHLAWNLPKCSIAIGHSKPSSHSCTPQTAGQQKRPSATSISKESTSFSVFQHPHSPQPTVQNHARPLLQHKLPGIGPGPRANKCTPSTSTKTSLKFRLKLADLKLKKIQQEQDLLKKKLDLERDVFNRKYALLGVSSDAQPSDHQVTTVDYSSPAQSGAIVSQTSLAKLNPADVPNPASSQRKWHWTPSTTCSTASQPPHTEVAKSKQRANFARATNDGQLEEENASFQLQQHYRSAGQQYLWTATNHTGFYRAANAWPIVRSRIVRYQYQALTISCFPILTQGRPTTQILSRIPTTYHEKENKKDRQMFTFGSYYDTQVSLTNRPTQSLVSMECDNTEFNDLRNSVVQMTKLLRTNLRFFQTSYFNTLRVPKAAVLRGAEQVRLHFQSSWNTLVPSSLTGNSSARGISLHFDPPKGPDLMLVSKVNVERGTYQDRISCLQSVRAHTITTRTSTPQHTADLHIIVSTSYMKIAFRKGCSPAEWTPSPASSLLDVVDHFHLEPSGHSERWKVNRTDWFGVPGGTVTRRSA